MMQLTVYAFQNVLTFWNLQLNVYETTSLLGKMVISIKTGRGEGSCWIAWYTLLGLSLCSYNWWSNMSKLWFLGILWFKFLSSEFWFLGILATFLSTSVLLWMLASPHAMRCTWGRLLDNLMYIIVKAIL